MMLRRAFKNFNEFVITILACLFISSCASVPKFSKEEKQIFNAVAKNPLPEVVTGETGFAQSGSHSIWYERIRPIEEAKGSVLVVMGHGSDALTWPQNFITAFVNQGYELIRFDHRGTGLSKSTKKWKKKNAYSLNDMSNDLIAILNTLKIEKAHIVGVSMGGMIAQHAAINHPEKLESLSLIMTTGDVLDEEISPMSDALMPQMISAVIKYGAFGGKKGKMKLQVAQRRLLMGKATGAINIKELAEISRYNQEKRDGYHFITARHHQQAIILSNSRYKELENLEVPTLIVHGKQDPVIPIEHGEKLAKTIPNSETYWVENMGHDLPDAAISQICDKMVVHFKKAGAGIK